MQNQILILLLLSFLIHTKTPGIEIAKGKVFLDKNGNGVIDNNEKGMPGILVSNGKEVAETDMHGQWEIEVDENSALFVIKPSGFRVPVDNYNLPRYYYLHYPHGSSELKVKGVDPSGALPESINFPLVPNEDENKFSALLFGDPQARGVKEVNFISHDVVQELVGTEAAFGVTLGDITADGPALFGEISESTGQIGIPWYYIMGNHDYNRDAVKVRDYDASFARHFGPSTYAFQYGEVAFIGLNAIKPKIEGKRNYRFSEQEITFIRNYLDKVPQDKLIVFLMHVPIMACGNVEPLYEIMASREHALSVSGHTHTLHHVFMDDKMGFPGNIPHHHYINPTVSGSWWCGLYDERGIPHATMNDGVPNGYSVVHFDGNKYRITFKAAGRPENYQMNIYLPDDLNTGELEKSEVLVNVFAGSEKSKTYIKVVGQTEWIVMDQTRALDPACLRMHELSPLLDLEYNDKSLDEFLGWKMDYPEETDHMWRANLPAGIKPGTYTLKVKTNDMFGQEWTAHRIFRVH